MSKTGLENGDRGFYHIITVIICLAIVLVTSIILLVSYLVKVNEKTYDKDAYIAETKYNDLYFSDRILKGVTVAGCDVGGMTVEEAKTYLAGTVDYNIITRGAVLKFEDRSWELGLDTLKLTVDPEKAVKMAYMVGRSGSKEEQTKKLQELAQGIKTDISAIVIDDPMPLVIALDNIKKEIDVKKTDATVSVTFSPTPVYTYTDEADGRSLDISKAFLDISALVKNGSEIIEYELKPDVVKPDVKRSELERDYVLVSTFTTSLSASSSQGRIQNITRALEGLDNRVWMPGQTFSFNQWVGARTIENGFGLGVFINADQQYDETIGGGICQVSTTFYYASLLAGANAVGRNAPIEVIERRPHTWPSVYIDRGLDATVSWPHTDLKLFNNNSTPYFVNTSIEKKGRTLYVTVELYGMPLPNGASVKIETETIEEIQPEEPEIVVDTENKYSLKAGQRKVVTEARTGYTVNVYQIWTEPDKEPVKSLLTVSKYNPVRAKIYTSPLG